MDDRLITVARACDLTSLSRTTIWRLESEGNFPRAIQLMPNRKAYRESDVRAWVADKIAQAAA